MSPGCRKAALLNAHSPDDLASTMNGFERSDAARVASANATITRKATPLTIYETPAIGRRSFRA